MKALLLVGVTVLWCVSVIASDEPYNPFQVVQSRLERMKLNLPVSYKTNKTEIYCTIHCNDQEQRSDVYDAFRGVTSIGLTSISEPPSVCVVLVFNSADYQEKVFSKILSDNVWRAMERLEGKVVQKIDEGILVFDTKHSRTVLVTDPPSHYIDDDSFNEDCWYTGTHYEYTTKENVHKTVRKYTLDLGVAEKLWTTVSKRQAQREIDSRTK